MTNLFELRKQHKAALDDAERITSAAAGRDLTAAESALFDSHMKNVDSVAKRIQERESQSTIRTVFPLGMPGVEGPAGNARLHHAPRTPVLRPMSGEYNEAFLSFLRSGGKQASDTLSEGFDPLFGGYALPSLPRMHGAMYEGPGGSSVATGGAAVNVPTEAQLMVQLAVPDLGVRAVASVLPTATDIKIPRQTAFAVAGIKSESGSTTVQFTESDPTLEQFTLSAFMIGLYNAVSWELLQDVELFQTFAVTDLLRAVQICEDGYFVTGSGSGQPQGLIGNVGTGTGSAYAVESTGSYLLQSTIDAVGTLKAQYFPNAAWLMSRATATAIRKAQQQANLYVPVWTRENGRDFLHGFPVTYSAAMPSLPTATTSGVTPILFGSFLDGYVIGDCGGSGIFVKILDQPLALSGQTALLAYRRVDGRIRRSEAIQAITISHS